MNQPKLNLFVCCAVLLCMLCSCQTDYEEPRISLESYQIEEGFELEVIASEPFLEAPVAIDFDNQGRIWTVEMRGYMQTLTGESESMPNGVISILEDLDGDGIPDDMDDDYVEAGVANDVETENVVTRDFTREQKTAVDK